MGADSRFKANDAAALAKVLSETEIEATKHAAAYTRVLATSSEKKAGIDFLRAEIASLIW